MKSHKVTISTSDIYYNPQTAEVAVLLGYGIGNHLSVRYLKEIIADIGYLFPLLTKEQLEVIEFHEVNQSSRRHKNHWYCRFQYDLSKESACMNNKSGDFKFGELSIFNCSPRVQGVDGCREDEDSTSVINRLIHD